MSIKKIDIHLHTTLKNIPKTENFFISNVEDMLLHMQNIGIDCAILMSSGERNEKTPIALNCECLEICKKYPTKFKFMCNVDDVKINDIEKILTKYKQQGCVGIGEVMLNKKLDDVFFEEMFCCAKKLKLPILFHFSPKLNFNYGVVDDVGLPLLENVLKTHKQLIVIGHSQPF